MSRRLSWIKRHPALTIVAVLVLLGVAGGLWLAIAQEGKVRRADKRQDALQPFYSPPNLLPAGRVGSIIRKESLGVNVPDGGQGFRILYRSERSNGSSVAASGMVFVPPGKPPAGGWPVVAWAHPTVGMGRSCAPSRTSDPLSDVTWLGDMLQRGWIVTATDYAGLGTPGSSAYLVGESEARDVLNSVRAARNLEPGKASSRFALWGHSQGGHAVLFAATRARGYAPELKLVAAAAAAPAAELEALLAEQSGSAVNWVIGPEIFVSWPVEYPSLSRKEVGSNAALSHYRKVASECIGVRSSLEAQALNKFDSGFFKKDPSSVPSWRSALVKQTAPILPPSTPLFIAQGLKDQIVIPNTTALYAQRSCRAGSNLTMAWMGGVNHLKAASTSGPFVASWLFDRFAGRPSINTCDQPLPIAPAKASR